MTRQPINKTKLISNRALENSILRYTEDLERTEAIRKAQLEAEAAIRKAQLEAEIIRKAKEELLEAKHIANKADEEELEASIINQKLNVITETAQAKKLITPSLKHMFYITSSLSEISSLLEGKIDDPKKFIKTLLFEFYEKTHIIEIEILEIFNESLKEKMKQEIEIDNLIEQFSIINMDGSFLLMFEPTHIKLVLHEFIKLVKYIF
jgi:predicted nucleic acid-binding protein